jgi:hypothetical protein
MSYVAPEEILVRFEKLRGSAALPGRERRHQLLNAKEVSSAILGLVPPNPNWAGHAFSVLRCLSPVGGRSASFQGKATLLEVIEELLTAREARRQLVRLMISSAESGTNSTGQAALIYEDTGSVRVAYYVPQHAISKLQPGAETEFNGDDRDSPLSREVSFNRRFFDELARAMEMAKRLPPPTDDPGSEYDAEDARKDRYKQLGVTPSSRFLHIGVDNQVTWPQREMLVRFDRYHLVLLPKTRDHVQSVHVDLVANELTSEEATTVINRFLSILAWCDDQFAIAGDGWSGNPNPVAVPKRNLAFTTAHEWVFDRRIPDSDEVRRALALYREARNAQQNFMVSYAVLNFVKVIDVRHPGKNPVRNWFRDNFDVLRKDRWP